MIYLVTGVLESNIDCITSVDDPEFNTTTALGL